MPEQNDRSDKKKAPESPRDGHPHRQRSGTGGGGRFPRPPLQTLIFWLVLFFVFPITFYLLKHDQQEDVEKLTASDFERILQDDRVLSTKIIKDPSSGTWRITGEYQPGRTPSDSGNQPEARHFRTEVVYSDNLDSMLREHSPEREVKTESNVWTSILISLLPILVLVAVIYFLFSRQLKAAGKGALQFGKSRARMMNANQDRVTFKDVSGIEEAKEEVTEIVDYLKDPDKFRKLGGTIPKGVLMIGAPGTGKTLLARAIAGEADVPFFSISGSDFVEMFVGVGASRVRDMFEEGKRHAPCIIFIDEIDAVGRSRFSGIGGGHDEREQTLNALLVEMDGFEANTGIIVIAATNRPDVLDPALLRPGRFDRQITIDLPDVNGRFGILKVHATKVRLADDVNLLQIAKGTPGYSGADLANLINEAALLAARLNKPAIEQADLEEARDKVRWGRERRSISIDVKDRKITAFHEAGHTLVGLYCEHATPLHKVTIIPRGSAYLGATMNLPENDRYTQGYLELMDQLAVMMAGRIAEELIFDDVTSGAAADIKHSTSIAHKMVCQWGMSKRIGPLNYAQNQERIFVGRDITRNQDHSEKTAREIDQEMRRILTEAENRARTILTENLDQLRLLGDTLLERETMSANEIRTLLGMPIPEQPDTPEEGHEELGETGAETGSEDAESEPGTTQASEPDATVSDVPEQPRSAETDDSETEPARSADETEPAQDEDDKAGSSS